MTCPSRLLICDDEPELVEVLQEYFSALGHTVQTASNASQARVLMIVTTRPHVEVFPSIPVLPLGPLSRAEVDSFAGDGFRLVRLEQPPGPDGLPRWRAEFRRDPC